MVGWGVDGGMGGGWKMEDGWWDERKDGKKGWGWGWMKKRGGWWNRGVDEEGGWMVGCRERKKGE